MKKIWQKEKGFTLIELLIVVAIIGIVAGIAIPRFLGARTVARVTRAFADMRTIADGLEMYFTDENKYPTALILLLEAFFKINSRMSLSTSSASMTAILPV
ncbi:unnamed protein product [marine sediment metagenome]|uniref:Type II secretion system protein GspG C-terminal domain-containing protein n=1 Tax=marine sediment metagenome TaxID=412755 RepID=X1QWP5_9ZZZZ